MAELVVTDKCIVEVDAVVKVFALMYGIGCMIRLPDLSIIFVIVSDAVFFTFHTELISGMIRHTGGSGCSITRSARHIKNCWTSPCLPPVIALSDSVSAS